MPLPQVIFLHQLFQYLIHLGVFTTSEGWFEAASIINNNKAILLCPLGVESQPSVVLVGPPGIFQILVNVLHIFDLLQRNSLTIAKWKIVAFYCYPALSYLHIVIVI